MKVKSLSILLAIFPIIAIIFASIATYGSGFLSGQSISEIHSWDVSYLGNKRANYTIDQQSFGKDVYEQQLKYLKRNNHKHVIINETSYSYEYGNNYLWIWICGFIMSSLIILLTCITKQLLMKKLSYHYPKYIIIVCIIGCISLIIMTVCPSANETFLITHFIAATISIGCFLTAQLCDILHWIKYLKQSHEEFYEFTNGDVLGFIYGCLCVFAPLSLIVAWIIQKSLGAASWIGNENASILEWIGIDLMMLGFFSQTLHAAHIYKYENSEVRNTNVLSENSVILQI